MSERAQEIEDIPIQKVKRSKWPEGVRTIAIDEFDGLGVDRNGDLFWQGRHVEIKKPLFLTFWQKVGAILVASSSILIAAIEVVRFYFEMAAKYITTIIVP